MVNLLEEKKWKEKFKIATNALIKICAFVAKKSSMPRIIKSGLIQLSLPKTEGEGTIAEIKEAMVQKHIPLIEEAGKKGVQILCFQSRQTFRE